jgi:Sec-independent protein secretion pathway component TatC
MIAVSCHTTIYVTTCSEKKETKKSTTKSVILFSLGSQESPEASYLFLCGFPANFYFFFLCGKGAQCNLMIRTIRYLK